MLRSRRHDLSPCLRADRWPNDNVYRLLIKGLTRLHDEKRMKDAQFTDNNGINGNILKWIKNFLQGRTQQVIVEGHHSNSISITSGVPQGTVLAPLLFLCYINDLPTNINSKIKLYADDVLIYRPIKSLDDHKILQEDLNTIDQWAVHCQARFNPDKCEHSYKDY